MVCDSVKFTEKDIPDLSGYVIIVTGGNSGIGYETAYHLALNNARVYISSRSKDRVDEAISSMNQRANKTLDLHFLQLDLQNLKSVKQSAEHFRTLESRLDVLINNAGIMAVPYKLTTDGYESQFQVNYLAPFVFTEFLMPLMLETAKKCDRRDRVRVLDLSSEMTSLVGPKTMQLNDVNMFDAKGVTVLLQRYSHAKQGSIRHAAELNDRYANQGVTAYSLHPGVVKSNLQGHDPSWFGRLQQVAIRIQPTDTPLQGALTSLYLATKPEAMDRGAGKYHTPVAKVPASKEKWTGDKEGNRELWEWSEDVVRRLK